MGETRAPLAIQCLARSRSNARVGRVDDRIVGAQLLEDLGARGAARVGDDDPVVGSVAGAHAAQADSKHVLCGSSPTKNGAFYTNSAGRYLGAGIASLDRSSPRTPFRAAAHEPAHLLVLLEQPVDLGDRGPRARRDPLLAAAVQDLGVAPLVRGHGVDHGGDPGQRLLVHALRLLQGLERAALGEQVEEALERPHLLHRRELVLEVLEGELAGHALRGQLLRRVGVDGGLDLLDQRQHVAQPQDPRGHAVGMERLEVLGLLADAHELDRLSGRRHDRQRGAAARVAVGLGQDDAGQGERAGEAGGGADRVLPGHRVGDEEDLLGLDGRRHGGHLAHQILVDVQAAGGVDDDGVPSGLARLPEALARDLDGILASAGLEDRNADLPAEGDELLNRGGPRQVGGDDQRIAAARLQMERELRGGGRLAGALETDEQNDRGFLLEREVGRGAAEKRR